MSASVVLASRLSSDVSVFSLMLFSIQSFALFPFLRRRLQVCLSFLSYVKVFIILPVIVDSCMAPHIPWDGISCCLAIRQSVFYGYVVNCFGPRVCDLRRPCYPFMGTAFQEVSNVPFPGTPVLKLSISVSSAVLGMWRSPKSTRHFNVQIQSI